MMWIKGMLYVVLLALPVATYTGGRPRGDSPMILSIDVAKKHQTIDNFAASDAWACQFAGNWPDVKRNQMADWLFSRDTLANGSPRGIALSLWRINIGAGSAEQGDSSGITDEWHRAASPLNASGNFDKQQQTGLLWFAAAAKQRGVKQFLGFCNSPPVNITLNNKAFADKGKTNIAPARYNAFANFLANVTKSMNHSGIKLNYISPVNEPQWAWSDNKQEGCPYTNAEIAALTRVIGNNFKANGINTKLLIAEAGSIDYLTAANKGGKGNQVNEFFRPGGANYLGDLPHVEKRIAAHSYFTTSPAKAAWEKRRALADSVAHIPGLGFWQSEYCILGDNAGELNGSKRDLGIDAALYLARVIHTDLTVANATAWQWWLAISPYDYKDGLIYIDKNKTDGNIYSSKMLWAMGNYSRFIPPGAIRIDAALPEQQGTQKQLLVSAYRFGKHISIVIVNENKEAITINPQPAGTKINLTKMYVTDALSELKASRITEHNINILPRSVTTLTGTIQ